MDYIKPKIKIGRSCVNGGGGVVVVRKFLDWIRRSFKFGEDWTIKPKIQIGRGCVNGGGGVVGLFVMGEGIRLVSDIVNCCFHKLNKPHFQNK